MKNTELIPIINPNRLALSLLQMLCNLMLIESKRQQYKQQLLLTIN